MGSGGTAGGGATPEPGDTLPRTPGTASLTPGVLGTGPAGVGTEGAGDAGMEGMGSEGITATDVPATRPEWQRISMKAPSGLQARPNPGMSRVPPLPSNTLVLSTTTSRTFASPATADTNSTQARAGSPDRPTVKASPAKRTVAGDTVTAPPHTLLMVAALACRKSAGARPSSRTFKVMTPRNDPTTPWERSTRLAIDRTFSKSDATLTRVVTRG